MSGIYYDEHKTHKIDLSKTIWSTGQLHSLYEQTINNVLSDVDWIGETTDNILLIEFKSQKINEAETSCTCMGCDCFSCKQEINNCIKCGKTVIKKPIKKDRYADFHEKSCKKFYGSSYYLFLLKKYKPIKYYCVIGSPPTGSSPIDKIMRGRATNIIKKSLPFKLQETIKVTSNHIDDVKVLSVNEWNHIYADFPITKV